MLCICTLLEDALELEFRYKRFSVSFGYFRGHFVSLGR